MTNGYKKQQHIYYCTALFLTLSLVKSGIILPSHVSQFHIVCVLNVHCGGAPDCNRKKNLHKNPANQYSKKNSPGDAPALQRRSLLLCKRFCKKQKYSSNNWNRKTQFLLVVRTAFALSVDVKLMGNTIGCGPKTRMSVSRSCGWVPRGLMMLWSDHTMERPFVATSAANSSDLALRRRLP